MKSRFLTVCAATIAIGFVACNNDGTSSTTGDSMGKDSPSTTGTGMNSTPTMSTSEGNYSAMYDTLEMYSSKGRYLNPSTGKPYKSLKVDRSTGMISDDMNQPVYRYVDNTNWWVYSDENMEDSSMTWSHTGEAKMEGEKMTYKGDGDTWVDYNTRYKADDEKMNKKWKSKDGEIKIKTEKDGDMKIKVGDEKIKVDEDGVRKKN